MGAAALAATIVGGSVLVGIFGAVIYVVGPACWHFVGDWRRWRKR